MGIKKKKNIIILTVCVVICFTVYQLYFFLTISSETSVKNRVVPVLDVGVINELHIPVHTRSKADRFINENGIIRGIYYLSMPRYRPDSNEFKCLNSEQRIPYEQVNDDYCDCDDSSDEPSTNACVNGTFYCDTQSQGKPVKFNKIPSGKVNDGICDCCDGSDEWIHKSDQKILSQSSSKHYRYKLWNQLPSMVFPNKYDMGIFKKRKELYVSRKAGNGLVTLGVADFYGWWRSLTIRCSTCSFPPPSLILKKILLVAQEKLLCWG